jgi:hypothetical protein
MAYGISAGRLAGPVSDTSAPIRARSRRPLELSGGPGHFPVVGDIFRPYPPGPGTLG